MIYYISNCFIENYAFTNYIDFNFLSINNVHVSFQAVKKCNFIKKCKFDKVLYNFLLLHIRDANNEKGIF